MRRVLLVFAIGALAATVMPARAAGFVVIAGPGSSQMGFTTQAVPYVPGSELRLVNGDLGFHDVLAEAFGSDERDWCGPLNPGPEGPNNPRRFPIGKCPLFWSELARPAGGNVVVHGEEMIVSGRGYPFYCSVFPDMRGIVVPV